MYLGFRTIVASNDPGGPIISFTSAWVITLIFRWLPVPTNFGAVVRGKGLIELRHDAADGGRAVDEIHIKTRFRQIKGGLHTADAAAYHEYGAYGFVGNIIHPVLVKCLYQ
jgi:hypothetical protein